MTNDAFDYDDADLQRRLAEDTAIAELGIDVTARGNTIVLSGHVESPERREAIGRRAADQFPAHRVLNEIAVVAAAPPSGAEEVR